ncbi:MAG: PspC domain-containing protein [Bacteroidales bacterium]|nr:PspC domain-containing protein [Bacteroidales bacterium]
MKKVVNVSLGGRNFTLEEDAYARLGLYLEHFKAKLTVPESQKAEVMDEIEGRMAELFTQEVGDGGRVVSLDLVNKVATTLGMPDGSAEGGSASYASGEAASAPRKLYRDLDEKKVAGVCSGLALYLDVDVTLIRVFMLVALICGSAGFWIYVIFWIALPVADTPAKKCELRGLAPTAENMSRFTTYYRK